jgi:hypothetical protein
MLNGAKPSGMFVTDQVIPDAKFKEIAARLKEAWTSLTGSRLNASCIFPLKLKESISLTVLNINLKYVAINIFL